jgi:hypothetical protein
VGVAAGRAIASRARRAHSRHGAPDDRVALRTGSDRRGGVALTLGGAALWLLWLAIALALVALNYALLGPAGFQKRDGRLTLASAALLAPYVVAARANVWLRTRGHAPGRTSPTTCGSAACRIAASSQPPASTLSST